MPDPVAWKVIERGWKAVAADGDELGFVEEVVGDSTADIFNGLVISPGLLRTNRYVPSEEVAEIVEGQVRLAVDAGRFEDFEEWRGTPPSLDILKPDEHRRGPAYDDSQ